jgi:RNA methyltransferase, TrmH family
MERLRMKSITSQDNPIYQSMKKLNTAKGRKEQGLFPAEGPHLAEEAVAAGIPIRYIAVRDDAADRFTSVIQAGMNAGAEILTLSDRLFNSLADTENPQGILVVAEINRISLKELDIEHDTLAVLAESIQDPGNLGTILRTAAAVKAGFAVVMENSADPWSQKVVRASQGAVFHLRIAIEESAADAVQYLNEKGWHTACGHLAGEDFFKRPSHGRTALVIGNEAAGVSATAAEACNAHYRLPMPGGVESLNAAVAAGIMRYVLWREQNKCL